MALVDPHRYANTKGPDHPWRSKFDSYLDRIIYFKMKTPSHGVFGFKLQQLDRQGSIAVGCECLPWRKHFKHTAMQWKDRSGSYVDLIPCYGRANKEKACGLTPSQVNKIMP